MSDNERSKIGMTDFFRVRDWLEHHSKSEDSEVITENKVLIRMVAESLPVTGHSSIKRDKIEKSMGKAVLHMILGKDFFKGPY